MITGTRFRLTQEINRQAQLAREIARGQTEITTGKKILAPSDDPLGAARAAEIRGVEATQEVWLRNVTTATALAAQAETAIKSTGTALDRAKELMLRAKTGTSSADDRALIASELRGLASEIASYRSSVDTRGEPLFRIGSSLAVPVNPGTRIAPVASREAVFSIPIDIVAALQAAATAAEIADPSARAAAVTASIDSIDRGANQIATALADQGIRADWLDKAREKLIDNGLVLEEQRSAIEGADITEVLARIQMKDVHLKAAQAIFAEVNKTSLFDLIR
ncbi:flagellin [Allosphingosinicella deserti]|uniref:Flagellin-like protein n=1 Tax=Allosphingosinicella deserti TaxID=2116704 RepID=A0A2P7QNW9_9SPHN|nr:flagellin-like protein [Sphingomonas deserti]PSJ39651.1 flagellin-like protein [Sphingomonas deserti]